LSIVSTTQPSHGSATIAPGGVKYTPAANYNGIDSFTYTISDGHGGSDTATVTMTVTPVNDAPTLDPIADQTTQWGGVVVAYAVGHDVDSAPLTYSLVGPPSFASVDSEGTITLAPLASDIGVHTITARVTDGALNAERSFKLTVKKQVTTIVYTGATSGQYSDPAVAAAKLTGLGGAGVGSASVAFTVAGQPGSAPTNGGGNASTPVVVTAAPGASTVVASYAGSAAYEPTSVSMPFTVNTEDAAVAITGPGLVMTSGTSAPATFSASLQETAGDSSLGSFNGAQVRFTDLSDVTLCTATVSAPSPGAATASCATAALSPSSRGIIAKLVSASYAAPVDVATLAVATTPTSGAAAGGGSVSDSSAKRADFAFRAAPGKKGGAPAGDAVQVWRQLADLGGGGGMRSYAFVVNTSSLSSLTTSCSGKSVKVCSAVIQGGSATTAAVDLITGAVTAVVGTSTIRIDTTDNAEPSGSSDRYAVSIVGPRSFSVGSATDQRLLTGGNIRIPV
jgi:hypothetical protein